MRLQVRNRCKKKGRIVKEKFGPVHDIDTNDFDPGAQEQLRKLGEPMGRSVNGNLGQTLFPGNISLSGKQSLDNNIQVIINEKSSINHRSLGIAHEFGHVLLYLKGKPFGHGQSGVDDFIYGKSDIMLKRLGYDF